MDISNVLLNEHKSEEEARASEDKFYKAKYRELKRKLKDVVSTNEYLKSELRHSQKKLQVSWVFHGGRGHRSQSPCPSKCR